MRRFRTLAVALVVLAVGATVAIAAQAPNPTNAGFTTKTYNHFGDPARGTVVVETWGIVHDVGDPGIDTIGVGRAFLVSRALRVAVRVQLLDDTGAVVMSTSASNSNGANMVTVSTGDQVAGSSTYKTVVFWAIRWDDGFLSKGTLEMPALYDPTA
jgi:hypothetical protein